MIIMQNEKNSQLIEQIACNWVNTFGLVVSMEDTGGGGDIEWEGGPSDCDLSLFRSRIELGFRCWDSTFEFLLELASLVKCR